MNGKKIRLALIQMDCKVIDKNNNHNHALNFLDKVKMKTDIACFPEFFTTGYNLNIIGDKFYDLAETIPGKTTKMLGKKAKEKRLAIVGTIVEKDILREGILYNTAFVIDKDGRLVGKYRKFYLYPPEHCYFRPGSELPIFDLGITKVGIAICYDHAFPELFRVLALKGAEIVFIPSAVPQGYEYLLNLRTRARAQDNQFFVAAINRVGQEGQVKYCGLSKIINPRGEVIAEASLDKEEIVYCKVDINQILQERKQEPILRSLRSEIYKRWFNLL